MIDKFSPTSPLGRFECTDAKLNQQKVCSCGSMAQAIEQGVALYESWATEDDLHCITWRLTVLGAALECYQAAWAEVRMPDLVKAMKKDFPKRTTFEHYERAVYGMVQMMENEFIRARDRAADALDSVGGESRYIHKRLLKMLDVLNKPHMNDKDFND